MLILKFKIGCYGRKRPPPRSAAIARGAPVVASYNLQVMSAAAAYIVVDRGSGEEGCDERTASFRGAVVCLVHLRDGDVFRTVVRLS